MSARSHTSPVAALGSLPRWLILVAVAFLALFGAAVGQSAPAHAASGIDVVITVTHDQQPVAGTQITVMDGAGKTHNATTDATGKANVHLTQKGKFAVYFSPTGMPAGVGPEQNPTLRSTVGSISPQNIGVPLVTGGTVASVSPTPLASAAPSKAGSASGSGSSSSHSQSFMNQLLPKIGTGLTFGLLLALASIGISLIYGTTGLNNFAHGELVTFGAFVGYVFCSVLGWPGWIGLILALVLGGAFGWMQDAVLWRPLRKHHVGLMQIMIVSIGLSLALRYIYAFIFGPDRLTLPADNRSFLSLGPIHLRFWDLMGSIIAIVLIIGVAVFLNSTKIGKATRAVADNKALAAASGINVERVIRIVWILGAALAGVSGILVAYYQTLRWDTGASILLLIFAAVTLGGLGTTWGALVGSIIIGLAMDVSTVWIPADLKYVMALLIMIVVLLVRPQGLLGKRQRIG